MKMNLKLLSTIFVVALFCLSSIQAGFAQENARLKYPRSKNPLLKMPTLATVTQDLLQQKVAKPSQEIKIFRLKSADPELAMQIIATMVKSQDCRIAVDPRSNGIIVAGSKATLEIVEAVLMKLDEESSWKSTIVHLKNVPAEDASKILLKQLGSAEKISIVTDIRQNALLISAPEAVKKKAMSLLEVIDVPVSKGQLAGKNVLVNAYWIVDQASIGDRFPEWKLRDVPDSIQKLVRDKLAKRTNIKNPMMAANLAVQAKIGEAQETANVIRNSGSSNINEQSSYEIDIQGTIWNAPISGSKVDLELEMQIALKGQNKKSGESRVQTMISSPLNHPICLGMTPVNGVDSILVLEIVEAD